MIKDHKAIYNIFGSGIYRLPHSIFKSKSYKFYNGDIGLFSDNDTRMDGNFIGIYKDMRIIKEINATASSAELNIMDLNSKLSKVISYIHYNKSWERIYII